MWNLFLTWLRLPSLIIALSTTTSSAKQGFEWSKIEYLFQFGDSYTSVGYQGKSKGEIFDYLQPKATTSGGPMYGTVLAVNGSTNPVGTRQIDYGVSGASINNSIVDRRVTDFVNQTRLWMSDFGPSTSPSGFQWNSTNSLYTVFFGINDLDNSQDAKDQRGIHEELTQSYFESVDKIYGNGARNFLFLNVPPTNRSPAGIELGTEKADKLGRNIQDFNLVLGKRISSYCSSKGDISCLSFDVHSFLSKILDDPNSYGFFSATAYCPAYSSENGVEPSYYKSEDCEEPLPSYIWWDDLHITWPVHKLLGDQIAELLKKA